MNLDQAKQLYPHRFTMEHVPRWATLVRIDGSFYAPQYRSDQEWFENTVFPPYNPFCKTKEGDCYSSNYTWPLGESLDRMYERPYLRAAA